MESEMIKVEEKDGVQTVSARELHEKLGINAHFKDWMPRMIAYGFVENVDYVLVAQKRATNNPRNPETTYNEYYISIDMAKEICMIQRSEIGRQFRQYFIQCEKKLKEVAQKALPDNYLDALKKLVATLEENQALKANRKAVKDFCREHGIEGYATEIRQYLKSNPNLLSLQSEEPRHNEDHGTSWIEILFESTAQNELILKSWFTSNHPRSKAWVD